MRVEKIAFWEHFMASTSATKIRKKVNFEMRVEKALFGSSLWLQHLQPKLEKSEF